MKIFQNPEGWIKFVCKNCKEKAQEQSYRETDMESEARCSYCSAVDYVETKDLYLGRVAYETFYGSLGQTPIHFSKLMLADKKAWMAAARRVIREQHCKLEES